MSEATLTPPSAEQLAEVALNRDEYELAVTKLDRVPNEVELGIIGALWSEHCSYKTSKALLSRLPTTGVAVLQGPGENAGAVDIGDGLAVVFKIESHNHPSAVEPYEGAATGVGGILRDIFTMGARPIALLDSLRFGPLDEVKQQRLLDGVVAGIGGYGNCIGVPTVGGEVAFDPSYRQNCLVNAMCVGIIEKDKLTRAVAAGSGNPVLLVGADTGRDGIHGATFASVAMDENLEERRPAVQVGNPFLEKCLMEACLELAGDPRVVAMQDLGAAGLTSSCAELAHRGGCGIAIDVAKVSRREVGMSPYEVMLSESQERMLLVVQAGREDEIAEFFARWDLHSDVIGEITDDAKFRVLDQGQLVCDLPLAMLIDEVPLHQPTLADANPNVDTPSLVIPWDPRTTLLKLVNSPNIGSRRPIFQRYDHQVGDDTVITPGQDAALIRVRGSNGAIALTTDGNASYCALDSRVGAAIAVCEAARNVVAVGAKPLAITNCLNFGNPENPTVYRQLSDAIDGIAQACKTLGIPVVSGNVSLYNDTGGSSIDPTPVIGMVGHLADISRRLGCGFESGHHVALVGPIEAHWGGSELQKMLEQRPIGTPPPLDLKLELRVLEFILEANDSGLLRSAHDCAEGGLSVAIAESCLHGDCGVQLTISAEERDIDRILFGEAQSRFVISYTEEDLVKLEELVQANGIPFLALGQTGRDRFVIENVLDLSLSELRKAWETALVVSR